MSHQKYLSRREFLKGTTAGALGVAATGLFGGVTLHAAEETEAAVATAAAEKLGEATVSYEADVVIAGAGAAGLMAAMNLARAGKKVIIMEAAGSAYTSNFAMCGGPAACETKLQKEEDAWVSLDTLFSHMYEFSNTAVNGKLLRKVLAHTGKAIDDMLDLGIEMYLWEDAYDNGFRARHYILSEGADRIDPIVKDIEANGGEFLYSTKALEPVMEDGKVVGLKGTSGDDIVEVRAKASLITTGGFLGNTEMQKQYYNTPIFPLGNTVSDGSGIDLVHKAGGADDRTFAALGNECGAVSAATEGWPFTAEWFNKNEHYGYWLFGGLYTDGNGERFINEEKVARLPLAVGGEALVRQGRAYCIMDSEYYEGIKNEGIYAYLGSPEEWVAGLEADYYRTTPENAEDHLAQAIEEGWGCKADTLAEIAEKFGLDRLEETVAQYNGFCDNGADEEFYKSATFLKPVKTAPFYAFEYVPSAWGTCGGVKVDASLRALDGENNAIEGLYVAGVDTGSMYTCPYYDNPGSAVGLAVGSSVLAADEIAEYIG
jgi:fumarate reductase flavoprotein subunit